mgnify:CR=1 FL=1
MEQQELEVGRVDEKAVDDAFGLGVGRVGAPVAEPHARSVAFGHHAQLSAGARVAGCGVGAHRVA